MNWVSVLPPTWRRQVTRLRRTEMARRSAAQSGDLESARLAPADLARLVRGFRILLEWDESRIASVRSPDAEGGAGAAVEEPSDQSRLAGND